MKKISTLFFLTTILFAKFTNAQTPSWLWAEEQTGGSCYTQAEQLSVSSTGGIYISGRFAGSMTLGGKSVTATKFESVFSAKLDTNGNTAWLTTIDSISSNTGYYNYGYGRDYKNNTYPTGPGYIAKVDSNGAEYNNTNGQKWPVNLGNNGIGYDVKADKAGNVYVVGEFGDSLTIGTKSVSSLGSGDMFVAKFDSAGNCKWLVSGGGTGYDGARAIGIDGSGYLYVCGSYSEDGTFGTLTAPAVTSGFPSVFIAKYDTAGNVLRLSTATNAGFGTSFQFWRWEGLAVDSLGNAYVTGSYNSSAKFGSILLPPANNLDIFVAKCHFDGQWEWAKNVKSTASNQNEALGIALDKANDIYVVGDFFDTCHFGNFSVTSGSINGSSFVAKYVNSTGDAQWVQTSTGSGNCGLQGVGIAADGSVYVDGILGNGTAIFGTTSLTDVTSCGQSILVAKLGTVPSRAILPVLKKAYCLGTIDLHYKLVGTFNADNVFTAQLSDSTGNFITHTDLGSVTSDTEGVITIGIPGTTPPGRHYRIRIVSSSPATGSSSLSDSSEIVIPLLTASVDFGYISRTHTFIPSIQGDATSYLWDFGDGTTSTLESPTHTYKRDTIFNVCFTVRDSFTCSFTICGYVMFEGVQNISAAGNWNIYPNSFTNELNIEAKTPGSQIQSLEVYDVLGRVVLSKVTGNTNNSAFQLNTSSLANGMYYLQIKTADASYIQKVAKQ